MRVWMMVLPLLLGGALVCGAVPNPDVHPDGKVDETDLAALAGYLAGNPAPAAIAGRADLSGDGQVRANDLVELQLILGGTPIRNYVLVHRTAEPSAVPATESVIVSLSVVHYGTDVIRGFYVTDYIPEGLDMVAYSVWLDGTELTDVLPEAGLPGGINSGAVARRWILELPPDFGADHPLWPGATLVLVMELAADSAGSYDVTDCSWVGFCPDGAGAVFAAGDDALCVSLLFHD